MAAHGDDDLVRLIYTSFAADDFDADDLVQLLTQCRAANRRRDVTGLLLFRDQRFLQALEGPRPVVDALMAKIADDLRHIDVYVLLEEPIADRRFPEWSMGFQGASDDNPWPEESVETFRSVTAADPSDENLQAIGELFRRFSLRSDAALATA